MKTIVLQLEQHDDIVSTRDKMGWAKSDRILLIWPERGRVLNRRLDLVLLQRHSLSLGAPIGLVTSDPEIRYYAPRLGIPVFKSLRQAQNAHWRVLRRSRTPSPEGTLGMPGETKLAAFHQSQPQRKSIPHKPHEETPKLSTLARLLFFTLGVLALLAIAATLLPSAQITLRPRTQSQEITIEIQANPEIDTISLSGMVPARRVTVIVEGRDSLPVSGAIMLPDRPAIGYVSFTNLTDQLIDIPEGTVVRTPGKNPIRFTVTQSREIPAGPGNLVTIPVRSLIPGNQGNLPADSLVAIEGLLGTQLSVTNPEPTQHGTERRELSPTQADRRKLASILFEGLKRTALKEIRNELEEGDLLIPASLKLLRTLEETYQPADLQPADRLNLSQRLEFQASFVSTKDLYSLAQSVLNTSLPEGFAPLEESLEIENLDEPAFTEDSTAYWRLRAKRQIRAQLLEPQAIQLTLGVEPWQAKAHLEASLLLEEPPRISLFPSWWPRLPFLPFRIAIILL